MWFYRHSDGYPSGTMPTLKKFIRWVNKGKIRNNNGQAGGWLILIGAEEYGTKHNYKTDEDIPKECLTMPLDDEWKCGAYEPTHGEHGDIEYLYTINMDKKTLKINDKPEMSFDEVEMIDWTKVNA